MRSRYALVLAALPLITYAWACSDDATTDPSPFDDAGVGGEDSGNGPPDGGGPDEDVFVPPQCEGNPLTADGTGANVVLDAAAARPILVTGQFNDGPQWVPNGASGNLVFSQFQNGQVIRIDGDGGTPEILREFVQPIGNALRSGMLLTAVASSGSIYASFADGGDAGAAFPTAPAVSPNDLVVGVGGNVYFTDPRYQGGDPTMTGLYRMDSAGVVSLIKGYGVARVNGIALAPGNLTMYVGTTEPKAVVKYTVGIDGAVDPGSEQPFLGAGALGDDPDGIAVDIGGNVWVAEAATANGQSGRVEVFDPAGQKLGELPFPTERPTGVTFGGSDNKTVYITTETAVWVYVSRCAGPT